MPNTVIKLKRSGTVSNAPVALEFGELAINYADGYLYYKAANGTVVRFASGGGDSFGTVNANGTLVVADAPADILTLVTGNNITITGDAVNDRVTIGLTNSININGTATFTGPFTINNGSGAGGSDEGGEIQLANAVSNSSLSGPIAIDIYQNKLRFFEVNLPNRGAFINLASAAVGVGTDLLAGGGETTDTVARNAAGAAFDKANAALANTNGATFAGSLTVSTNLTADKVISTNNGQGENFQVGDDAWIGDTNVADTVRIKGQQNSANAFIAFGNNDGVLLGRAGSGNLTYGGNTVWHSGIDGAGSGLDADLLDGQQGTYYATATDSTAAFERANVAVANVNYVNTAMQAAFTRANTGISNTENVVFAGNNFFFTSNIKFVGSATRITYTSDSVYITNGAQTNKPALQLETGAGTGGIVVGRGSASASFGHDSGSQTYIGSTNWGGLAFTTAGNLNHQANNGMFRFTGDSNSYAASNGVIQVVAASSVGFYVRFTKDALTSTSNLRLNDVFTVSYSGNVNTLGSIESTGLKVIGSANITSNLLVLGVDVLNTLSGANTAVGAGANAFASATIAGANTAVGTGANAYAVTIGTASNTYLLTTLAGANTAVGAGANAFATAAAAGANAFMISVQNGSNTAIGTGANAFTSATIAGANTAVGTGANTYLLTTLAGSNTAVGTGANAFMISVQNGSNTAVGLGANNYANSTFVRLTAASQTITGDVTIVGNLNFSGNTSFSNVQSIIVNDPLIYLAGNNASDIVDIGFFGNYVNATGANVHTGLYREHVDKMYYLFQGYDKLPDNNHIGALSNNMTLAVLNADLRTSNLSLGGANAITWITASFAKANTFDNVYTTIAGANAAVGTGANTYLLATLAGANAAVGTGANTYLLATLAGANTAVGTGANSFATAATAGANAFMISVQNGSNTAVGAGANTYLLTTLAGANTAVGAGANAFATAAAAGANAFMISVQNGSNTAVGTGANTVGSAAFAKANAALANTTGTFNGALTVANDFAARNANYTFTLPNVLATASWIKLGTFTASQDGRHIFIKVVTSHGYNATTTQQGEVYIHFKTSNGVSVDANGFAGEATFYITNSTTDYDVKVVSNAAGVSATSFDIYFYQSGSYNGAGSFYTVELGDQYNCTWTNSSTTSADPGAASSSITVGTQRFIVQSNVGIGTTSPTSKLHVVGAANITTSLIVAGADILTTIAGANVAVGAGANTVGSAAFIQANAAVISANLDSVNATRFMVFEDAVTGTFNRANVSHGITYNPSSNTLNTGNLVVTGNVGLGRANPGFRLDVVGTINASSILVNGAAIGGATLFTDNVSATRFVTFSSSNTGTFSQANVASSLTFNPSTGTLSATIFNATSDANSKQNIKTIENGLNIINSLRGVSFDWKDTGKPSYGLIAQEVEEHLPALVYTDENGKKSLNYDAIIGFLVEAIKELKKNG